MDTEDDIRLSSFFVDPDKVAQLRIVLGLEPYGHLADLAFRGIMSDLFGDAMDELANRGERAQLLFEREKTATKLRRAVAADLGLSLYGASDVERTKVRDRLRELIDGWARAEEESRHERPVAVTQLDGLLQVDYTISKQLSELQDKPRKRRRAAR